MSPWVFGSEMINLFQEGVPMPVPPSTKAKSLKDIVSVKIDLGELKKKRILAGLMRPDSK